MRVLMRASHLGTFNYSICRSMAGMSVRVTRSARTKGIMTGLSQNKAPATAIVVRIARHVVWIVSSLMEIFTGVI